MKKTLKIITVMAVIIVMIGITNVANAFSFNANLSSTDKLEAGKEVKVTLSLNNIDMDKGIYSIQIGKITVGEEFEPISASNFSSNTCAPTYSNGGLILMSGTPITSNGAVVVLTLKVKPGTTAESATVKFENIVASSGSNTGDISVGTKTITIKANEPATSGDQQGETTDPDTNNAQNGTDKPAEKDTSSTTQKGTSSKVAPTKLPKAGNVEGMLVLSLIVIVAIVGTVSFVKYKKVIQTKKN